MSDQEKGDVEFDELFNLIAEVRSNFRVVLTITIASLSVGALYALLAPAWYQAEVVLFPATKQSSASGLSQIGGLASIAGLDIPGGGSSEPVAVLKSRSFAREFIVAERLMPVLYAPEWDESRNEWKSRILGNPPDLRDGVDFFDRDILGVVEDKKTGLVTLTVKWHDPALAAKWANMLARRLNDRMRNQAIAQASTMMEYLQKEMANTSVLSLQTAIGRVLEAELQKMAFARANEEFAFRVVDEATAPSRRRSPHRLVLIALSLVAGFSISVLTVYAQVRFAGASARSKAARAMGR